MCTCALHVLFEHHSFFTQQQNIIINNEYHKTREKSLRCGNHHIPIMASSSTNNLEQILDSERYNILIEFAHRHVDFQRAELESVLSIHDIVIGRDCIEVSLPTNPGHRLTNNITNKVEEDEEVDSGEQKEATNEKSPHGDIDLALKNRPFMVLSFSYEFARSKFNIDDDDKVIDDEITTKDNKQDRRGKPTIACILSKCTLIRCAVELWGIGIDLDTCAKKFLSLSENAVGKTLLSRYMEKSSTWKITVHTLGSKFSREEQNAMRFKFSCVDFPGKIRMVDPTHEYIIIREIALNPKGGPIYPRRGLQKEILPHHDKLPPLAVYYGRILGGKRDWREKKWEKYNLKKRTYLGPTSMDSELSLIMTNLGRVQKGSICFDPFVGTGSILLTCALKGGYCVGTDIDIRVLRGRSDDENIFCNFKQYNLGRPELIRSDNAIYHRHYRTVKPMYDAIITDPPYGIRAGARKSGSKFDQPRPVLEEHRHDHIAQTKIYPVSDVMADLLDVAARTLVMGGRLVYIIPSMTDFDIKSDLPQHECLELKYISYQPLQLELGRRMVTMEKVKEYNPVDKEKYLSNVWVNGPESAEKCARIRERLLEAAKLKPEYEEKAAYRKKRRQATKEAKKKAKNEMNLKNQQV